MATVTTSLNDTINVNRTPTDKVRIYVDDGIGGTVVIRISLDEAKAIAAAITEAAS